MITTNRAAQLAEHAPEMIRLAEEVSLAVIVDSALLRRTRLEQVPSATSATEADLWFSALVRSRSPDGFVFAEDAAQLLRGRLAAEPMRLQSARDRVAAAHVHLPPALRLEEELLWLSCRDDADARERCETLLRSAVAALARDGRAGIATWAARALPIMRDMVRGSEAGRMLQAGVSLRIGGDASTLLAETDTDLPEWLRCVAPPDLPRATLRTRLLSAGIEIDAGGGQRGHVIEVPATNPLLLDVTWAAAGSSAPQRVHLPVGQITLITGDHSGGVHLTTLTGERYFLMPESQAPALVDVQAGGGAAGLDPDEGDALRERIRKIVNRGGARNVAVAWHDYETRRAWSYRGDEWFHAAGTIKVPVMVSVFGAIQRGELALNARVHVRNGFISVADGVPFQVAETQDEVQESIGRSMKLHELLYHMVAGGSNLATNLLIDLVGVEEIRKTLSELGLDDGIELRRGLEDQKAFEAGISNRCTADGLLLVLRLIEERRAFSPEASERMLEILHAQEFRRGVPAGLPQESRVANKTGETSTVSHDAGIVYLPGRKPYVMVALTEWDARKKSGRSNTIARISRAVYEHLTSTPLNA